METPSDMLRSRLGERIPIGGTDADTMFTNAEILDLLSYTNPEREGWRRKAAEFASLVDTTEGTSKRAMSDLHKQALEHMEAVDAEAVSSSARTRSHRIRRGD